MKRLLLVLGSVCLAIAACSSEPDTAGGASPADAIDAVGDVVVLPASTSDAGDRTASFVVIGNASSPRSTFERKPPSLIAQEDCAELVTALPDVSTCTPTREREESTPAGAALIVWNTGTNEELVTVAFDDWTLALRGPDTALALRIAHALEWERRPAGAIAVWSTDDAVRADQDGLAEEGDN